LLECKALAKDAFIATKRAKVAKLMKPIAHIAQQKQKS
jgi:hypothetical protein